MPFLGTPSVPRWVRVSLALFLALVIAPVAGPELTTVPKDLAGMAVRFSGEVLIGLLFGLIGKIVFASLEIAGELMGFQIGFSFIHTIDPNTDVESPFIGMFLNLVGILVFLGVNGHHWFIQAVTQSYRLSGGSLSFPPGFVSSLLATAGEMFVLGFKVAAPVVLVMFLIDLLFGILGRTAPQIPLLIIGLPAKGLAGFVILAGMVYALVPVLTRQLGRIPAELAHYLELVAG